MTAVTVYVWLAAGVLIGCLPGAWLARSARRSVAVWRRFYGDAKRVMFNATDAGVALKAERDEALTVAAAWRQSCVEVEDKATAIILDHATIVRDLRATIAQMTEERRALQAELAAIQHRLPRPKKVDGHRGEAA